MLPLDPSKARLLRFILPLLYRFCSLGLISGREAWNDGMRDELGGLRNGCVVGLLK